VSPRAGQSQTEVALAAVSLHDEATTLEATFLPGAGMLCCSLRHRGEELLAQNAGVGVYAQSGKTMGIPLLYPWANRLAAFDYVVAGREVAVPRDRTRVAVDGNGLPIHGVIGGRLGWELMSAPATSAHACAARLSWEESNPELFAVFPFRHDLLYEAHLAEGRLRVRITVHACGADAVPVAFGFHPYLSLPGTMRERWRVELPAMRALALDPQQIPVGAAQPLPARRLELGELDFDDGFDSLAESARFAVADGGRRIVVELLEGYSCAQVYAPRAKEVICFEPMTARANALRSGVGLRVLAPGECYRAVFAICVEDLR
jgi:aldose 1-epimerase